MYLADYHTHSRISSDSKASMVEMAQAAVKAGLDEMCFTDHVEPVEWYTLRYRNSYDWAALLAEFETVKAAMGDQIQLRLGVELGDAHLSFPHAEQMMSDAPELDFIIGSVHLMSEAFGEQDFDAFIPKDEKEALDSIADYLKQVQALAEWGKFTVLGHLTLPLRYFNGKRGFHLTFDQFESQVETIFKTLIRQGKGIELNTNRGSMPLPDEKWLRMYRSLGGEIITLGSDAHSPQYVGCTIRERQQLLRSCGFTKFCTFEKMQPIWHDL